MTLLETINSPADIKKIPPDKLPQLAQEIRQQIVAVASENGGHLAPSLGVVELTIALHRVFDLPDDKIIWDVGHQSYAHKLLTGRREKFHTLRQLDGISGFTKVSESPYDAFTTGHSSTSISAGTGIACAKALKKDPARVVAVIGDGSMTAGMAFEAMNQNGEAHKDKSLIVILNDNEMSINRNVGAISSLLSRTFSATRIQTMRKNFGEFLRKLPRIGDNMYHWAKRSEESFKTFVTPGMLFEAFNFDYFGPIDGHNLDHLTDILDNIKDLKDPVLLHVITRKGKGYKPAENNPVSFHGCGRFDVKTGACIVKKFPKKTYTQVFGETLTQLAQEDSRVVAITAAMPAGTGLTQFSETFPDRFFDVGIAEQHGVTFAAGMASEGFKPVVAIYSTFLQRGFDQIIHDVCLESLPVIFALDRGGLVGEDGPTHHGAFDLSYLRMIPNMTLMAPKDENELAQMLKTAITLDGPCAIRYPRGEGLGVAVETPPQAIPLGKAEILTQGDDLLIFAVGRGVTEALTAETLLRDKGIQATVVNMRFIKPLDHELILDLALKVPRIITVEENVLAGGFGTAVMELLADHDLHSTAVKRIGITDTFVPHGASDKLRKRYKIDADAVVKAAEALLTNNRQN